MCVCVCVHVKFDCWPLNGRFRCPACSGVPSSEHLRFRRSSLKICMVNLVEPEELLLVLVEVVAAAAYLQPRGFLQKLRMISDEKKRFDSQRGYITGSMWQPPPRSAPSNLQICFFGGWWGFGRRWGVGGGSSQLLDPSAALREDDDGVKAGSSLRPRCEEPAALLRL